jgi:PAP2 superfamily
MSRAPIWIACAALACAVPLLSARHTTAVFDPLTEWSAVASTAANASGMAPLRAPITLALLHLAMYDAVNAIAGGREAYASAPVAARPASAHAAAIEAGYRVLRAELPTETALLDATYAKLLAEVPDASSKANGMNVGAAAAAALLKLRADDGRNASVAYTPGSEPGAWVPTPPGFLPATTAFLAGIAPFTMDSPSQFRPSGPPALQSKRWAEDYDEVKALGVKDNSARTVEQTATALFWEPLAGTVWPATIRRMARERALDVASSARFQASAFAAFADGLIACWDAKFHFNFWRPVTAIQLGDLDRNRMMEAEPGWQPLANTPNFPEYPSGHACATAAVAHTIDDFFHGDVRIPARNVVTGEERLYRSANAVVEEVVEARMLLGVHFRAADEDGADMGRRIARQIRRKWFKRAS